MFYEKNLKEEAIKLRLKGFTYTEINKELGIIIPKGTLNAWLKKVSLPDNYKERIKKINNLNLDKARTKALKVNKLKREEYLRSLDKLNIEISGRIKDPAIGKIALAMLCLGEASKYKSGRSFNLGSSDPKIIKIFLELLRTCFSFKTSKIRCTVQCRADQDLNQLEKFWMEATGIPREQFYKPQIDKRTIGKPTLKEDYKGVLRVDYLDRNVQLELESLANLIYNQLNSKGPEV